MDVSALSGLLCELSCTECQSNNLTIKKIGQRGHIGIIDIQCPSCNNTIQWHTADSDMNKKIRTSKFTERDRSHRIFKTICVSWDECIVKDSVQQLFKTNLAHCLPCIGHFTRGNNKILFGSTQSWLITWWIDNNSRR